MSKIEKNIRPLVSVYIPTHNRVELLKRAIDSVLRQTYKKIEIIVCDDGSSDSTEEFIRALCVEHQNIVYLKNYTPMGACAARNLGITAATGEFVTGLDDDDYFEPERISFFLDAWCGELYNKKIAGLFDSVYVMTPSGFFRRHIKGNVKYKELRRKNLIGSQVFAPKEYFINAGLFDPAMPAWQDWDMWLRMSKQFGDFLNINKTSYIVDECHDFGRITAKSESTIRFAKRRLTEKLGQITFYENAGLVAWMQGYPQVKPTFRELLILLIAGRIKTLFFTFKKLLKGVQFN